jgi:hypothetical protein
MTLPIHEFLRRFLQHVLPTGFQKIRAYGFLSPNARLSAETVRWLATIHADEPFVIDRPAPPPRRSLLRCADCGAAIRVVCFVRFNGRACFDSS